MSLSSFKIDKPFGPPRLRKIVQQIVDRINQISPIPGAGIDIDQEPDGRQISTKIIPSSTDQAGSGGPIGSNSGTPADLVGAVNGAPGKFHLIQNADPEPL